MFSFYLTGFKKILDLGKKIFLVLAVYFVFISLFLHFIAKDKPKVAYDPIKKNRENIYKTINDPQLNKTREGKASIRIYRIILCLMTGEACTDNPADGDRNFNYSFGGLITKLIIFPYVNPPASGIYWAYSGLQNTGFIPKTLAAESMGFAGLKPVIELWKAFRNITYFFLVFILIALGFMIMFRMKINPQTVITIENSLPRLIVSLILIVFSYAIAGFLIDLMYIILIFFAIFLKSISSNTQDSQFDFFSRLAYHNHWKLFFNLFKPGELYQFGQDIYNFLPVLIRNILGAIAAVFVFQFFFHIVNLLINRIGNIPFVGGIISVILTFVTLSFLFKIAVSVLIAVFVSLTFIFIFFRVFFLIFKSYLSIFLMVIFAPVILIFELIPGKNTFAFWLKNLLSNILTFPLVILIFLISNYISLQSSNDSLSYWQPPLMIGLSDINFAPIIALGLIFLIPNIVAVFKKFLGAEELPLSIGAQTFLTGGTTALGGAFGFLSQYTSLAQMPLLGKAIKSMSPGFLKNEIPPTTQEAMFSALKSAAGAGFLGKEAEEAAKIAASGSKNKP